MSFTKYLRPQLRLLKYDEKSYTKIGQNCSIYNQNWKDDTHDIFKTKYIEILQFFFTKKTIVTSEKEKIIVGNISYSDAISYLRWLTKKHDVECGAQKAQFTRAINIVKRFIELTELKTKSKYLLIFY